MANFFKGPMQGISLEIRTDVVSITSERETPDEAWRLTDSNGHDHYYDKRCGYPTLLLIVDAQHWCNGNEGIAHHDPHMHIDKSHYVCLWCGVTIRPGYYPPYHPRSMPGMRHGTVEGFRSDGFTYVSVELTDEEMDDLESMLDDKIALNELAQTILDMSPRVTSTRVSSG